MYVFVIYIGKYEVCIVSILDLFYKFIKVGNIFYYLNYVIFCYFFIIIFVEKYNGIYYYIIKFYILVIKVFFLNFGISILLIFGFLL